MNNLLDAIELSRNTTLERVFTAIGIANVGKKTARLIAKKVFESISGSLIDTISSISVDNLLEVKDIGPETADAFVTYMTENKISFERLIQKLNIQIPEVQST